MSQQDICNAFLAIVTPLFPNAFIRARPVNFIGEFTITITFAQSTVWANNIIHNDPAHMTFLVQHDAKGWYTDPSIFPLRQLKANGGSFRKIRGKTEEEVVTKLSAWFVKNVDAINLIKKDW
jgi:hypothetical protein